MYMYHTCIRMRRVYMYDLYTYVCFIHVSRCGAFVLGMHAATLQPYHVGQLHSILLQIQIQIQIQI
jgi:hypothetical protein